MTTDLTPKSSHDGIRIISERQGGRRSWRVAGDRVEMFPVGTGWDARIHRDGLTLDVDAEGGHFADEAQALVWCLRMADVLARDAEDDLDEV